MSSSSVSVSATAAIPTPLFSKSSWHHHRLSVNLYTYKLNPTIHLKLNPVLRLITRASINCISAGFDGIEELDEELEDTDSEIDEEEIEVPEAGRLYVGNLPFSMTLSQLSEIFAGAGRVLSVEIVYDKLTDRSRGFAFVTMSTVEEAKEAIRLFDGAQIGGRSARVNFPEVPRGGEKEMMNRKIRASQQGFVDSPHKIYAGNLSWRLTSENLREAFEDQPGFLSSKVVYDRDSGRSRGFGFITFSSAQDVESALNAMNGVELEGRPLRLNLAEERAPVSLGQ